MKSVNIISIFTGISMFMFGFLKLFYPISEWFHIQISKSGLPGYLYWPGILSEILVGLLLLSAVFFRKRIPLHLLKIVLLFGSMWVIGNMAVAVYVHLQPAVPAYVLPLKIKPPYMPLFFIVLAAINMLLISKVPAKAEIDF